MKKYKKLLALLLAVAVLFSLAACGSSSTASSSSDESSNSDAAGSTTESNDTAAAPETDEPAAESGSKTLTLAITSAWDTLSAHGSTTNVGDFIVSFLYEPLLSIDSEGNVVNRLADSWEWSENGTVITFHINEDAVWSDGEPVVAEDFVLACQLISKTEYQSRSAYLVYFDGVDDAGIETSEDSINVVAADDKTVVCTLKGATDEETLFAQIKNIRTLPSHIFSGQGVVEIAESALWREAPVTNGPFLLDQEISGEQIEYAANENYYLGAPNVDRIIVKVMTASTIAAGLISGDVDFTPGSGISSINYSDYETLAANDSITLAAEQSYGFNYLAISWREYEDVRVRQALNLAINRSEIVDKVLLGNGEPLLTQYTSISDYYLPELYEDETPGYDPDRAVELLNEAGWDFSKEITLYYHSGNDVREQTCLLIQQQWQSIGLNVKLQAEETSSIMAGLSSGDFTMGTMGQTGDSTPYTYADLYTMGHFIDFSHLSTSYFSDTMNELKYETDTETILAKTAELQEQMIEQVPYIYLYSSYTLQGATSRVQNLNFADSNVAYWPFWLWDVA